MKIRLILLLALVTPAAALAQHDQSKPAAEKPAAKMHPLSGVVVDVMPDRESLLVKHEEIPGVMRAMTMMFRVEKSVLAEVKKGDALTAKMGRDADGKWILREVKVVEAKK